MNMLLNNIEFLAMNNFFRAFIQDKLEIRRMKKCTTLAAEKTVLEIGCGNGTGTRLIQKYFSPKEIHAIDLDEKMIKLAKKNNRSNTIHFQVASATKLPYESNSFDAVFNFGVIHHIPNWEHCLVELRRVLKPNGILIMEDLSIETFETFLGNILKRILKHPYAEMYTQNEFIQALKELDFTIEHIQTYHPLVKYFVVVAKK